MRYLIQVDMIKYFTIESLRRYLIKVNLIQYIMV